jgi:DNA repair exonuclease SbcCD ATPase subunit
MSDQITQWLTQIKELKQQLAEIQRDRNEAYASADNWRQLYNTEAQQRRTETKLAQQQVESLKSELRNLQGETPTSQVGEAEAASAIEQELANLETTAELKAKLKEVIIERNRLIDTLKTEQANHAQTRKSLTAVIGDTIDQLAKERGTK